MRAGCFEFLGQRHIVFEVIFGPVGVQHVAGIADHALADLVGLDHRVHRDAHVLDPVEAVKDAEDVDATFSRLLDEEFDDIVGIVGVAHPVRAAQQHLGQDIGRAFAHLSQPFPGILIEEAHGDVERRPTPAFKAEQVRQTARIGLGDAGDIERPHARRQQRLMRVAHGGVGEQDPLLVLHPFGKTRRAVAVQHLPAAFNGCQRREFGDHGRRRILGRARAVAHFGVAVHRHVGDVAQQLGRAVLARLEVEQVRCRVDEARGVAIFDEIGVRDDVLKERQIGGDAANAELAQGAMHAGNGFLGGGGPAGDLFQQRIVIAGDHRARIGRAAIKAHAKAGGAAIGGDAAIIGDEVLLGVLGGHPALDGIAVELDVLLGRHA